MLGGRGTNFPVALSPLLTTKSGLDFLPSDPGQLQVGRASSLRSGGGPQGTSLTDGGDQAVFLRDRKRKLCRFNTVCERQSSRFNLCAHFRRSLEILAASLLTWCPGYEVPLPPPPSRALVRMENGRSQQIFRTPFWLPGPVQPPLMGHGLVFSSSSVCRNFFLASCSFWQFLSL